MALPITPIIVRSLPKIGKALLSIVGWSAGFMAVDWALESLLNPEASERVGEDSPATTAGRLQEPGSLDADMFSYLKMFPDINLFPEEFISLINSPITTKENELITTAVSSYALSLAVSNDEDALDSLPIALAMYHAANSGYLGDNRLCDFISPAQGARICYTYTKFLINSDIDNLSAEEYSDALSELKNNAKTFVDDFTNYFSSVKSIDRVAYAQTVMCLILMDVLMN